MDSGSEKIIEQVWIDLANNLDPTEFLGENFEFAS